MKKILTLISALTLSLLNSDLITNKTQIYVDIIKILGFSSDKGITYNQGNLRSLTSYYALMNNSRFSNDIWNDSDRIHIKDKIISINTDLKKYL